MSSKKEQEFTSVTTGIAGNNNVSAKIRTPKPKDQSGQSGFGEQESGTGIARISAEIRDREQR